MKTKFLILLLSFLQIGTSIQAQKINELKDCHPKYDAAGLVSRALFTIHKNYPNSKNAMNTFYKENIYKNNECISTNEAILDVVKESYLSNKKDIVAIKSIRGNSNLDNEESLMVKLQGGPISALELDVAKNPFLGCYAHNISESYTFEYDKSTEIDRKDFYVVNFNQLNTYDQMLFRGKIYIEKKSLAIGKIEYSMNVEKRSFAYQNFFSRTPKNKDIIVTNANYVVNYKDFGGKWYYDYSTSNINFTIINTIENTFDTYLVNTQMAVTTLIAQNISIDKKEMLRSTDILSDKVKDFNLASDWDIYNLIMLIASK